MLTDEEILDLGPIPEECDAACELVTNGKSSKGDCFDLWSKKERNF